MATHAKYKVHLVKGKGVAVVRPPNDIATIGGGTFEVTNKTSQPIHIYLPPKTFGNGPSGSAFDPPAVLSVAAGAKSSLRTIHVDATEGVQPFQIFCEETNGFAQGNSDPEIIIEN